MLAAHRLSVRCWAGQLARSRCIPRSSVPAFRWQPVLASAEGQVGDSGSPDQEPVRKMVTFLPYETQPLRMTDLSQCQLEAMLKHYGARGFVAANGKPSRTLAELPEGGTVRLSYRWEDVVGSWGPHRYEVKPLRAYMRSLAGAEHGGPIASLQREPFKDRDGDKFLRMHSAFIAGDTLYVGHYQQELDDDGVWDINDVLWRLRHRDESPELASALQGVTSVKLFLAGERVQAIPVIEALVKEAAERGVGVLLPSRDGLGLDGNPAAAQPL